MSSQKSNLKKKKKLQGIWKKSVKAENNHLKISGT